MCRYLLMPLLLVLASDLCARPVRAGDMSPVAYQVDAKLPDALQELSPAAIELHGWLGHRVALNEKNRLAQVDLEPLLAGYRHKPGTHPWIGEHIGKWMHAATLAWAYTGDESLRKKLDYAAEELIKSQEADGYLGTYTPDKRFGLYPEADWDVWSHKYCLMGLLTYYRFTGNTAALDACRKVGDLLIKTFGPGPGQKSIIDAGTHVGMAATSVLEPMVLLYRHTGDQRYLEFARYLVQAWNEPAGPKIIATLLEKKQVNLTANAKAYEMLSNLVGLCELARASGDRELLQPVLLAWEDIVAHRLYLTGSASQGEHFREDHYLPNHAGRAPGRDMCHDDLDSIEFAVVAVDRQVLFWSGAGTDFLQSSRGRPATGWSGVVLLHGSGRHQALWSRHQLLRVQRPARHGPRAAAGILQEVSRQRTGGCPGRQLDRAIGGHFAARRLPGPGGTADGLPAHRRHGVPVPHGSSGAVWPADSRARVGRSLWS